MIDLRHKIIDGLEWTMTTAEAIKAVDELIAAARAPMVQQEREQEQEFVPWDGRYEKQWYDVRTKEGKIYLGCWPNAGFMMVTDGSGAEFSVKDSISVRLGKHPLERNNKTMA